MLRVSITFAFAILAIVPVNAQQVQLQARKGAAELSGAGHLEVGDTSMVFEAKQVSVKLLDGRVFIKGRGQVQVRTGNLEFQADSCEFEVLPDQISFRLSKDAAVVVNSPSTAPVTMSIEGAARIETDSMSFQSSRQRVELRRGQLIIGKPVKKTLGAGQPLAPDAGI